MENIEELDTELAVSPAAKYVYDGITKTSKVVELDETDLAEFAAYEQYLSEQAAEKAAKALERQALLDKLGITAEEAELLLNG